MILIQFKIGLYHVLIMQFPIVITINDMILVVLKLNSCSFLSHTNNFLIVLEV